MQEIYGHAWKQQLNNRQRSFVKHHEMKREIRERQRKSAADPAGADRKPEQRQPESEWRKKVETKKQEIQWQKKLTWTTPSSFRR